MADWHPAMAHRAAGLGARLEPVPIPWDCGDGIFHAYWRQPEQYLRPEVRRGISVCAAVGAEAEQRMTRQLRDDLASGRWAARNRGLTGLAEAELGALLLII